MSDFSGEFDDKVKIFRDKLISAGFDNAACKALEEFVQSIVVSQVVLLKNKIKQLEADSSRGSSSGERRSFGGRFGGERSGSFGGERSDRGGRDFKPRSSGGSSGGRFGRDRDSDFGGSDFGSRDFKPRSSGGSSGGRFGRDDRPSRGFERSERGERGDSNSGRRGGSDRSDRFSGGDRSERGGQKWQRSFSDFVPGEMRSERKPRAEHSPKTENTKHEETQNQEGQE